MGVRNTDPESFHATKTRVSPLGDGRAQQPGNDSHNTEIQCTRRLCGQQTLV